MTKKYKGVNPPGEHDGNCRAGRVGYHGALRGRSIKPLRERQCGHDGRSYGTGRQYIQELCAVCRRPGGGNLTEEPLRETLSWDLQQVQRALQ